MWFIQMMRRRGVYMEPAGGDGGQAGGGSGTGAGSGSAGESGSGTGTGSGTGGSGSGAAGTGGASGDAAGSGNGSGAAGTGSGTGSAGTGTGDKGSTGKGAGTGEGGGTTGAGSSGAAGKGTGDAGTAPIIPENWREAYSKGDEKKLGILKRYASYDSAMDALLSARERISKGEATKILGDKPTEQEIAEYRAANNIPDKPDGYKLALDQGNVIDEVAKPAVDKMLTKLHELHVTPKVASAVVNTLFELQAQEAEDREQLDSQAIHDFDNKMRLEWGSDFKRNIKVAKTFMEQLPGTLGKDLMNARLPNGTPLGSSPEVLRWMVDMALQANPLSTVVEDGGDGSMARVEEEVANLTKLMGNYESEYWKGPKAELHQARYRKLVEAQARAKSKQ